MKQAAKFNDVIGMTFPFPGAVEENLRTLLECGDDEFEGQFGELVHGVETGLARQVEGSMKSTLPSAHAVAGMQAELLGILTHAYARVMCKDLHFGRKIVALLVTRLPRRSVN